MPAKSRFIPRLESYETDDNLRVCSLEAQGLWLRLLFVMVRQERGGRLPAADAAGVSILVGRPAQEIEPLLVELEHRGVLARDGSDGTLYCPRMARDHARYLAAKEHGKHGGNPFLKGAATDRVNPTVIPTPVQPAPEPIKPRQTNMFGDPSPKPATPGQRLYKEGLEILAGFAGKDLSDEKQKAAVIRLMSKMRKEAQNDDEMLLEIILRARSQQPVAAIGWIKGAIANGRARLVHSNEPCNDYGIERWCAAKGLDAATDARDLQKGKWLAGGKIFDQLAHKVAAAAKLPRDRAIDWQPLLDWVQGGFTTAQILSAVERTAAREAYIPRDLFAFKWAFASKVA